MDEKKREYMRARVRVRAIQKQKMEVREAVGYRRRGIIKITCKHVVETCEGLPSRTRENWKLKKVRRGEV